ncbi:alpha/beta hydrolase family protein [Acidisoma silvae]|uniref:Prolyl oligopeptidase family serine peptidase n=1 Tax=Acidisoma silvae TaxID=2802396 RepID=A0A964DZX8_9PROT|nr:CocE/NonD family hydrolase [Acidisoma silvae]MCB8876123.1 prolyl oligopeptidase family serine peptidase [Acidisoma silvae]
MLFAAAALVMAAGRPSLADTPIDTALNPDLIPPLAMQQQVMMLPADPDRPARLEVTLLTPEGAGPFPLVVLNHGTPLAGDKLRTMQRYIYTFSAYYFLSRGYAVAMPMMRGFAASEGQLPNTGCNLAALGTADARDILAIIQDLSGDPDLDTRRVVVGGQSFGGWNTLAIGALHPRNIVGLVSFAGGIRSSACDGEATGPGDLALLSGLRALGATTSIPSIWFFGDNDSLFPKPLWQAMFRTYTKAGGQAVLIQIGRFRDDSHQVLSFPEGLPLWTSPLDAFLGRIGMPHRAIFPAYLPLPAPATTHFAAVSDVAAVPNLSEDGRADYRHFLSHATPRAFVLAPDGRSAASFGGFDPLGRALNLCRAYGFTCRPYAVDDRMVWVAAPAPVPSGFAALTNISAVPYLNAGALAGYRKFLDEPLPRAFVISPDGSWVSSSGPDPASHALHYCQMSHPDCGVMLSTGRLFGAVRHNEAF